MQTNAISLIPVVKCSAVKAALSLQIHQYSIRAFYVIGNMQSIADHYQLSIYRPNSGVDFIL
jgi:hypothetical protein